MDHHRIESYIEQIYNYTIKNTYSRDEADELAQEILFTAIRILRRKIVMLSAIYRNIVVMYYYDDLSTKEIIDADICSAICMRRSLLTRRGRVRSQNRRPTAIVTPWHSTINTSNHFRRHEK